MPTTARTPCPLAPARLLRLARHAAIPLALVTALTATTVTGALDARAAGIL